MKKKTKQYPRKKTPKNVHAAQLARQRAAALRRERTQRTFDGTGRFCGTRHGYGFCDVGDRRLGEVFLPAGKTMGALDGDPVRVSYHESPAHPGRAEGAVTAVLTKDDYRFVGTLCSERVRGVRNGKQFFVEPASPRLPSRIPVEDTGGAQTGDKVAVSLPRRRFAQGRVTESFGPAASFGANYAAILKEDGVPTDFDPDVLAEAEAAAARPLSPEGRVIADDCIFTMDGADAKDLDDAVSLSRDGEGWHLGVHIADVSEYVTPHTRLDDAAMERGTSLYFVDKVVPMLPPALSNGACSLNAGEDKYALSARITLDVGGEITAVRLEKSIIRSRVRGVYHEVNDVLALGEASSFFEKYREVYPSLLLMRELYEVLDARQRRLGAIDFEAEEAVILLGSDGLPCAVRPRVRGTAEKIIEQFMLAANRAVAETLTAAELPCVYRVHEEPPAEHLADFLTYAHNLGLDVAPVMQKEKVTAADFSFLLAQAEEKGVTDAITLPMLRAMSKAKYEDKPAPHFGLSAPLYCHFTSPIRRLSDLATHRMIKATLSGGEPAARYRRYAGLAAERATETELRALSAERKIEALYKTLYLKAHEGECFRGRITSVTNFGFFVTLPDTCEGLVPLESLPEHYVFREETLSLSGKERDYRIADPVVIRVERAVLAERRVFFSLVEEEEDT